MFTRSIYNKQFLSLILANMFFWMSTNLFMPVLPLYYHTLGMNDYQIGIAVGAFSLGALMFRVLAGKAADRFGSTPIIAGGILVSIAAIASYLCSSSLVAATLSRFMHGLGISCYAGAALVMATLMHDEEHTAEAVAAYTLFTMIGVGTASSMANRLYAGGGFSWVVGVGMLTTLLSLLLFPKKPRLKLAPKSGETLPLRTLVTNPHIYVPTLSLNATTFAFASTMTFLPLLAVSKGVTDFNGFYVAYAVMVVLSRAWVRTLCAKYTPERLSYYLLLLFAVTMLIVGTAYPSPAVLMFCGGSIGIGYGLAFPSMATIVTANTQPANRGAALGFYTMAVDFGFGAGAVAMGAVAELWGYNAVFFGAFLSTLLYIIFYRWTLWPRLGASDAPALSKSGGI
ncbi:MAG: MFS transporter [Negativicutes bacterium]|nr:MFS transporter [Negativicutes bacterium]